MAELKQPGPGDIVIFHDASGLAYNALVTVGWSPTTINVVVISNDSTKQDIYGRQIERYTSVSHKSVANVHGFYFRWPDEEPNSYIAPASK